MKKINFLFMVSVIFGILLFSGCGGGEGDDRSNIIGSGTRGSTSGGVSLEFQTNNPPSEMFKDNGHRFAFRFTNFQYHEISDLRVRTRGFDSSFVSGLDSEYSVSSIPRATSDNNGVFNGLIVEGVFVSGFQGTYNFNPSFDWCYTATTTYRQELCIPDNSNVCTERVSANVFSNGPISVSLKGSPLRIGDNRIRIEFELSNALNGKVVSECFKTDDYAIPVRDLNVKLGTIDGVCTSTSDVIQFIDGRTRFSCEFNTQDSSSFNTQLSVEFNNLYMQSKDKRIVVRDLLN